MNKSKKEKIEKAEDKLYLAKYLTKALGGRWKLYILFILDNGGTVRFGQMKKKLNNISNVMLSKTLKELEQDGIIIRHQYNEVPPHVDYTLTEKGKNVIPALIMLSEWAQKYTREENITSECEECLADINKN